MFISGVNVGLTPGFFGTAVAGEIFDATFKAQCGEITLTVSK